MFWLVNHYVVGRGRRAGHGRNWRIGRVYAYPLPTIGEMDTDGTRRNQGGVASPPLPRHGSDSTEGRTPVAASTAERSRGLDSGSSGLVRRDLGMADHA